jgi:lipoprotein-releasing system permease protein
VQLARYSSVCIFWIQTDNLIKLNLEYFIAKRLITAKDYKSSISAPIIKLQFRHCHWNGDDDCVSMTGIGQQKSEKISAFNGHISISL